MKIWALQFFFSTVTFTMICEDFYISVIIKSMKNNNFFEVSINEPTKDY